MIKSMTKKTNNKKGFTLIELIVVIAILGILAAIAIPRISGFRQQAQDSADEATFRTVVSVGSIIEANAETLDAASFAKYLEDYAEGDITVTGTELPVTTVVVTPETGDVNEKIAITLTTP